MAVSNTRLAALCGDPLVHVSEDEGPDPDEGLVAISNVTPDVMADFCNINPLALHSTGVFAGLGPAVEYADMAAYARTRQVSTDWNRLFGPVVATGLMASFVFRPELSQLARLLGHPAALAWLQRMDLAGWYNVPAPPGYDLVSAAVAACCKVATAGAEHDGLCRAMFAATFDYIAVDDAAAAEAPGDPQDTILGGAPLRLLAHIAKYATALAPPDLSMLDLLLRHLAITAPDVFESGYMHTTYLPTKVFSPVHRYEDSYARRRGCERGDKTTVWGYVGKIVVAAALGGHAEAVQALCTRFEYWTPKCPFRGHEFAICARRGHLESLKWATAGGYYCAESQVCTESSGRLYAITAAIDACRNANIAVVAYLVVAAPCQCGQEPSAARPATRAYLKPWQVLYNAESKPRELLLWALLVGDRACLRLVRDTYLTVRHYRSESTAFPAEAVRVACLTGRLDMVKLIYNAMPSQKMAGSEPLQAGFLDACARGDMPIAHAIADLGKVPYATAFEAMRHAVHRNDSAVTTALIKTYGVLPADARVLRYMYTMGAGAAGEGHEGAAGEGGEASPGEGQA